MNTLAHVLICTNSEGRLYTGITRNVVVTMRQFKERSVMPEGWSTGVDSLLYFRQFDDLADAVRFEATLQRLSRRTQLKIANSMNPLLLDLSQNWFKMYPTPEGFTYEERDDASAFLADTDLSYRIKPSAADPSLFNLKRTQKFLS